MALLPPRGPGQAVVYSAAAAGLADEFANSGRETLHVRNAGASPVVVTINSVRPCDQGFDHDDEFTIAAGQDNRLGPFDTRRFNAPDGNVDVTYDQVASVTVAVIA